MSSACRFPIPTATRQHRPALVVSKGGIGEDGALLWVAMIISAENRRWEGDAPIDDLDAAGLPVPSVVRPCKIATIEARHAERLGRVTPPVMARIADMVGHYIGLVPQPADKAAVFSRQPCHGAPSQTRDPRR